jgi:hypothetical protein
MPDFISAKIERALIGKQGVRQGLLRPYVTGWERYLLQMVGGITGQV